VALVGSTDTQSSVHVHIVTGEVQGNQTLEDNRPARPGGAQEDEQAGSGAAIRDHIQHGTECGRLTVVPGSIAIQRVQQTRHAVENGTGARVEGHVVEGRDGKNHSEIS